MKTTLTALMLEHGLTNESRLFLGDGIGVYQTCGEALYAGDINIYDWWFDPSDGVWVIADYDDVECE